MSLHAFVALRFTPICIFSSNMNFAVQLNDDEKEPHWSMIAFTVQLLRLLLF